MFKFSFSHITNQAPYKTVQIISTFTHTSYWHSNKEKKKKHVSGTIKILEDKWLIKNYDFSKKVLTWLFHDLLRLSQDCKYSKFYVL